MDCSRIVSVISADGVRVGVCISVAPSFSLLLSMFNSAAGNVCIEETVVVELVVVRTMCGTKLTAKGAVAVKSSNAVFPTRRVISTFQYFFATTFTDCTS